MRPTGHEFSNETLMALPRALRARVASHPESPGIVAWLPAVREDRMASACAELLRRGGAPAPLLTWRVGGGAVARRLVGCRAHTERELPGLTGERIREQTMLHLGGERQRDGALAPLKEVGEPAVGDHDIGERVCRERDVLLHAGGALTTLWGTSHLFPTGQVVRGFGTSPTTIGSS